MDHLDFHKVLTDSLHGFRQNRSCEIQLAGLVGDLARTLDNKIQIDMVILDFSKAFDTLLQWIDAFSLVGINYNILNWIEGTF